MTRVSESNSASKANAELEYHHLTDFMQKSDTPTWSIFCDDMHRREVVHEHKLKRVNSAVIRISFHSLRITNYKFIHISNTRSEQYTPVSSSCKLK
ncbi:hypothetical protein MPER_15980, partial [Moniliophthora perniciosa FA553]